MSQKPHTESTSADKTALGFDFQYYFFLYKLLQLKEGESIGLEVKDDVHTDLNNDCQLFYQVKHTIHKDRNLTTRDIDLWKTLSNWAKIISDEYDNRSDIVEQIEFVKKSEFILFSNKKTNQDNKIINLIEQLKKSSIDINKFYDELELIKSDTASTSKIIPFINNVLKLDKSVLHKFILKVGFILEDRDIIGMIHGALRVKMVEKRHIEQVFRDLYSDIKRQNFITIKEGDKFQISFDDFYDKYRVYFHPSITKLSIRPLTKNLPSHSEMKTQVFIKQLLDIGDFNDNDIDELARLTAQKMKLENNIFDWHRKGEITHNKCEDFHNDAKANWKNSWKSKSRRILDDDKSLEMIDDLRKEKLMIDGQELDTDMSNGEFYYLSDIPEIGWSIGWEKYEK
ncbi:hypothetical protein [Psychrobacter sp. S1-30-MNA-CIBAN-0213]|uniref:hypothetical protein n=1 Tax=unclassified Psychrobacter TaxID=196806 RepID=UPI00331DE1E0